MRNCARRQSTAAIVWVVKEQPWLCICGCMYQSPNAIIEHLQSRSSLHFFRVAVTKRQVSRPILPNAELRKRCSASARIRAHSLPLPRPSHGLTRQGNLDSCTSGFICPISLQTTTSLPSMSVDMAEEFPQTYLDCTAGISWRSTDIAKPSTH